MPRIATVFLATGTQGSSVIRALLKDGTFTPRAVTRDANSDAAKALLKQGCEVVAAKLDDKDAVKKAVTGAECVALITLPKWSPEGVPEVEGGINVIDACKEAGVKFLAFSTLPSLSKLSNGKFTKAHHFDNKQVIEEYLASSGLTYACIGPGSFLENLLQGRRGAPFVKTETGYQLNTFERPGSRVIHTWIGHDMGPAVTALFTNYTTRLAEIERRTFVLGSGRVTTEELAAELAKVLGKPVEINRLDKTGMPPIDDMYASMAEYEWYTDIEVPDKRLAALGVNVATIAEFGATVLKEQVEKA
ncbi:hypothetical protein HDZ31DRAFT_62797 [Schizophyllum fasciatum]